MKVKVSGPMAGSGPHGNIVSWAANQVVEVDDADKDAVAFYRGFVSAGVAELIEEPKTVKATAATPAASTEDELPPPPKAGPGSSRDAWAEWAERQGVEVTDDMTRDDIIAAVES